MYKKILEYYFIVLFSIIPVAVVIGPTISLANILLIDISFIFTLIHSKNFLFLKKKISNINFNNLCISHF